MSQSSVAEQVKDLKDMGLPVHEGTPVIRRAGPLDPKQYGSDLWFVTWVRNLFKNYPLISQCTGARFLHEACHGATAFVVGVGPSLDESIADLKAAQGRSVIISTDAAFRALLANGITPDLVVSYDCKDDQKRLWSDIAPGVKVPALLSSTAHRETIMSWPGPILFFNQYHTQDQLCERILPIVLPELGQIPSMGTVGNMAVMAAHLMGCDPICCVGMDFCYQPTNGGAYRYRATDYKYVMERGAGIPPGWVPTEIKELYDNDERLSRSFMVKGDDGKEYKSDPELTFYFDAFKDNMPHFKVPILNCTPKGRIPDSLMTKVNGLDVVTPVLKMSVGEALDQYGSKVPYQGGRNILAHLDKIIPDPRKA
jgi:hypothetical protein